LTALGNRIRIGASLSVVHSLGTQAIRFGGNLLMTRLLFPEAFGLMGITQAIWIGVSLLCDVGLSQSVIRSSRNDEQFLNTIWTIQILRGCIIGIILIAASGHIANSYNQPALVELIGYISLVAVINSFGTTKAYLAERQVKLGKILFIESLFQLTTIGSTVLLALIDPSPRALAIGNIVGAVVALAGGHLLLAGQRNAIYFDRAVARSILGFSGWVMLSSTLTFIAGEGRTLIIGYVVPIHDVGLLSLSIALVMMIPGIIQQVSSRVLFPSYAEHWRTDKDSFPKFLGCSRQIMMTVGCTTATALVFLSDPLIHTLYDARYSAATAFVQCLAVGTMFSYLNTSYAGVYWVIEKARANFVLQVIHTTITAMVVVAGGSLHATLGVVVALSSIGFLVYPAYLYINRKLGIAQARTDAPFMAWSIIMALYVFQYGSWRNI
jgi:O-antigen/teichoic acid export membrane protein